MIEDDIEQRLGEHIKRERERIDREAEAKAKNGKA
jgi:hypothetical protein